MPIKYVQLFVFKTTKEEKENRGINSTFCQLYPQYLLGNIKYSSNLGLQNHPIYSNFLTVMPQKGTTVIQPFIQLLEKLRT